MKLLRLLWILGSIVLLIYAVNRHFYYIKLEENNKAGTAIIVDIGRL